MAEDFKLESVGADFAPEPTDGERAERVRRLCYADVYVKLSIWDRDFLTDIHGLKAYTRRQRQEIDRIWKLWKGQL